MINWDNEANTIILTGGTVATGGVSAGDLAAERDERMQADSALSSRIDALALSEAGGFKGPYDSIADGIADTVDGDVFTVAGGGGLQVVRNDGGVGVVVADLIGSNGSLSFPTRGAFVDALPDLGNSPDGRVVIAGGYSYQRQVGASGIPDIPDWIPFSDVTPMHFGAVGDGQADDTQAMKIAIGYGSKIFGEGKTFRVIETLSLPEGRQVWDSVSIDGTDIPLVGNFTTTVVEKVCAAPVEISKLTSNAPQGADTITVSNVSGLSVDSWVLIRSNKIMAETEVQGQTSRHSRACELARVRSISGDTIGLWAGLQDGYLTADAASIWLLQDTDGVNFTNITITGSDVGLRIRYGFESRYNGCSFYNQSAFGADEQVCFRTIGDKWYFESQAVEPVFTQAPYGLGYTGCHNCSYGDISGLRTRHLTTTGSSGTQYGRLVSRGNSLGDIRSFQSFSSVVDQHPGGGFIQVGNVFAEFAPNATQKVAIQLQGGGGAFGSVSSSYGGGLLMDSFGFFQDGFVPVVSVDTLDCHSSPSAAVSVINYTNRYGSGDSQPLQLNIGVGYISGGVGATIVPSTGDVTLSMRGGEVVGRTSDGLGRAIYSTMPSIYTASISVSGTILSAIGGGRVIQCAGGILSMSGGAIRGVDAPAQIRVTDGCSALISGAFESQVTDSPLSSATIKRAVYQ